MNLKQQETPDKFQPALLVTQLPEVIRSKPYFEVNGVTQSFKETLFINRVSFF
jgi:hypothetical protein